MNLLRFVIYVGLAGVGYAAGTLWIGGGSSRAAGSGAAGEPARSLEEWASSQPGAASAPEGESPRDEFERALRSKRDGLGSALRGHLRLVADTPIGELPALLLRSERTMPAENGNSVGELARDAIIERMLEEDPDALLEFALAGRSYHVRSGLPHIMEKLLEKQGFDSLREKIRSAPIPAVSMQAMESLLSVEIGKDPQRGWELAKLHGGADLDRLAQMHGGDGVIESLLAGDASVWLSDATITMSFTSYSAGNLVAAVEKVDQLDSARERMAAIMGLGTGLRSKPPQQLNGIAAGLRSDQERLALHRGGSSLTWSSPVDEPSTMLDRVMEIDSDYVRQTLLGENLIVWKQIAPDDAKKWAEAQGQLEFYENLAVPELNAFMGRAFPYNPVNPVDGAEFLPPPIPSDFEFKPGDFEIED